MFSRIVEPELMLTSEQVDAYASIDFTESHGRLISQITECFPGFDFNGTVLNLGCGTGDDSFRFLNQFPLSRILGIDGSAPMIARAKHDLALRHSHLSDRISFVEAYIPSHEIPLQPYVGIVSNSLLHHMHATAISTLQSS